MLSALGKGRAMKVFVYAYNHITLHKAITYAKTQWGFEDTFFMYTTSNAEPPKSLLISKYNNIIIDLKKYNMHYHNSILCYINDLVTNKLVIQKLVKYIHLQATNRKEEIRLVVFRDTLTTEALLIKTIKKEYNNVKIVLIEEGLALYASYTTSKNTISDYVKRIFHLIFRVPVISAKYIPHGCNPATDMIICQHPQELIKLQRCKTTDIEQEIDVFSRENCDFFISNVMMEEIDEKTYNYVFLTQPLFPNEKENENEKYDAFIKALFSILIQYGTILIKPHPRDKWDYSKYVNDMVNLCDPKLSRCAYEIISGHYGNPRPITLYSSAACNGNAGKHPIFLYDFFPELIKQDIFDNDFIRENGIVRCKTYKELEEQLSFN